MANPSANDNGLADELADLGIFEDIELQRAIFADLREKNSRRVQGDEAIIPTRQEEKPKVATATESDSKTATLDQQIGVVFKPTDAVVEPKTVAADTKHSPNPPEVDTTQQKRTDAGNQAAAAAMKRFEATKALGPSATTDSTAGVPGCLTTITGSTTCEACYGEFVTQELLLIPCGHSYCQPCLQQLFQNTLLDDSYFPAKCCNEIPLDPVSVALSEELQKSYRAKKIEYETRDRTYCSNQRCSSLLSLGRKTAGNWVRCDECGATTCKLCKTQPHAGSCNRGGGGYEDVLKTAGDEAWRRCGRCGELIERTYGCNRVRVSLNDSFDWSKKEFGS